jgi:hypothetical protein
VVAGFTAFGKSQDNEQGTTSEAVVEKELLAGQSKYDDQQKAA